MKDTQITISIDQFLKLKEFDEHNSDAANNLIEERIQDCQVFDFSPYLLKANEKKAQITRARERSQIFLNAIKGVVLDYEVQMLKAAAEMDRAAYQVEYNKDPIEQIQYDMQRLGDFAQALQWALDEKGARTLLEACDVLRKEAHEELVDTLNYILVSDFFGFKVISSLLQVGVLQETYREDVPTCYRLWNELSNAGYEYSLVPIASLCFEEAVAM